MVWVFLITRKIFIKEEKTLFLNILEIWSWMIWSMLRGDNCAEWYSWWSWWFVRIILWKIMPTLKSPPCRTWCFQTNLAPFFQEGFNQRLAEGNYLPGLLCQFGTPMKKGADYEYGPSLITMNLLNHPVPTQTIWLKRESLWLNRLLQTCHDSKCFEGRLQPVNPIINRIPRSRFFPAFTPRLSKTRRRRSCELSKNGVG